MTEYYAIRIVVILVLCAIIAIAAKALKIPIPDWFFQIIGALIVGFVVIFAIRLLFSM